MAKTATNQFTHASSSKLRLAAARLEKIVAHIEKVTKQPVPEAIKNNRKALIKLARENGWGYKGNVVNPEKKKEYGKAQSCGDEIAETLARVVRTINPETRADYIDMAKMRAVAVQNGISLDRWLHCNIGQMRMNMSNVLRGMLRRNEPVVIGNPKADGGEWNKDGEKAKPKKTNGKKPKAAKAKPKKERKPRAKKAAAPTETPVEAPAEQAAA